MIKICRGSCQLPFREMMLWEANGFPYRDCGLATP